MSIVYCEHTDMQCDTDYNTCDNCEYNADLCEQCGCEDCDCHPTVCPNAGTDICDGDTCPNYYEELSGWPTNDGSAHTLGACRLDDAQ